MGSQFWWFYDVLAVAIILVCAFIWGKKGAMKGVFAAVGGLLSVMLAFGISGAVSDGLRQIAVKSGDVRKLEQRLSPDTFSDEMAVYLENMGYSIRVDRKKLGEILDRTDVQYDEAIAKYVNNVNSSRLEEDSQVLVEKVHEGYAVVIGEIVGESLSKFAAETAADEVRKNPGMMQELIPLLRQEVSAKAADYIGENCTAPAYRTMFRLASFAVLLLVFWLALTAIIRSFAGNRDGGSAAGALNHIIGAISGAVAGAFVVLAAAAAVRLSAVLGSDEMLFFNNHVVEKSFVFRFFYGMIAKM
ncbi:MAG: hypothetical protein J6K77_04320 [Ruminococcus sp.]|nr:hypothetical protein [Ruminococcus sp.]